MEQQKIIADFDRQFDWHNYNESQTREKVLFVNILADLCSLIEEPKHQKGRKPTLMKDIVFSSVLKEYLNTSSRRVQGDLKLFSRAGLLTREIPFNTLLDHLEKPELKYVLKELVEISSLPLKQIELDFAIDATGFGVSRYVTYFDVRYRKDNRMKLFRKCHAVCGVKTNVITAVEITEGHVNDQTQFEPLAKDTARNFSIREFTADKGYLSKKNYNVIRDFGGIAFIPFKSNTSGKCAGGDSFTFKKMFQVFKEHREVFMQHYHKRSNIESAFSMIKRKFGTNVKCKKEISQDNEILSKVLAHNICVLVQELFLNKIDINFMKCKENYIER
jgi:transposase